jgi:hypothetical protein
LRLCAHPGHPGGSDFNLESRHSLVTKHWTIDYAANGFSSPSKHVVAFFGFPRCFVLVLG